MKVSYHNLHKLGGNLGLDEDRIRDLLTQYQPEEKHQRLVEMWFKNEFEPTWEKLDRALPPLDLMRGSTSSFLGESSTSMDSVPVIPPSSTGNNCFCLNQHHVHVGELYVTVSDLLMLQSNLDEIKSRFSELLISVRYALEANNVQVDDVRQILIGIFNRDDCIPRTNLVEIFSAVTAHKLWDYNNHSPVERLVRRFLRDHISEVTDYKKYLSGFYTTTKLIDYIRYTNLSDAESEPSELPLHSYVPADYRMLKVKLKTDRNISMLSLMYVQELWNSFAEEFEIPSLTAIVTKILEGCLEITWLIPPHEAEQISALAPKSTRFFRRLNIIYVSLNGNIIYDINQMVSLYLSSLGRY